MELKDVQAQLDEIAKKQNGGINEYAQKEIINLIKFVYLGGIQEGLRQAEEILR